MDDPGNHHSQKADTRTENQIPRVLTCKWVLNNENTWAQGGEHHTLGSVGRLRGYGRNSRGWGDWEGIALGEINFIFKSCLKITGKLSGRYKDFSNITYLLTCMLH